MDWSVANRRDQNLYFDVFKYFSWVFKLHLYSITGLYTVVKNGKLLLHSQLVWVGCKFTENIFVRPNHKIAYNINIYVEISANASLSFLHYLKVITAKMYLFIYHFFKCAFSNAVFLDSCQWATSEIPMILQFFVYNIAAFIMFCQKSVCHEMATIMTLFPVFCSLATSITFPACASKHSLEGSGRPFFER